MLILSRRKDESIMIGGDVEVRIVNVRGDKIKLGISAPKRIPVHRKEVYEAIKLEKRMRNYRGKRRVRGSENLREELPDEGIL